LVCDILGGDVEGLGISWPPYPGRVLYTSRKTANNPEAAASITNTIRYEG
jgi:hypothetical protein